ncbi:hypothetical protein QJS66_00870 [Kocuria rhizophila]|nr:hypothetical protein QJS66_00870 [Kocuria rhizophila]
MVDVKPLPLAGAGDAAGLAQHWWRTRASWAFRCRRSRAPPTRACNADWLRLAFCKRADARAPRWPGWSLASVARPPRGLPAAVTIRQPCAAPPSAASCVVAVSDSCRVDQMTVSPRSLV